MHLRAAQYCEIAVYSSRFRGFPVIDRYRSFQETHRELEGANMGPFQCAPSAADMQVDAIERQNSAFGDNYSIRSRSASSGQVMRFHDEPEADYDEGATLLYR